MAIASHKPVVQLPTQPNLPQVQPSNYKSIIYDDNNIPLTSLIAYTEGAPWTVDYYSQVLSRDNDLREVDTAQPNIYQQYQKVVGMEIRVSTALGTSYDTENALTTSTGNGLVYPFLVPNVNDYFVTDAGDTELGIFRITNVERKTFNRDSAFAIDYELVGYASRSKELFDSLVAKVIRTYYFSKDRLIEGLQPILKDTEHQQVRSLKAYYRDIVTYYFKSFFNRSYMTLVLPGQQHAIYDSFLVNYLLKIVDTFDAAEIRAVKTIPTDNDPYLSQPQLWSLLFSKDYDSLATCNQSMGLVTKYVFNANTFINGLAFSNIDYVVYPVAADLSVRTSTDERLKPVSIETISEATTSSGSPADLLNNVYADQLKTYSLVPLVMGDRYYVLSEAFYKGGELSVLEILVKDYLKSQALDLDKLLALCKRFKGLGRLEQFYYGPILLTLLKEADRASYG